MNKPIRKAIEIFADVQNVVGVQSIPLQLPASENSFTAIMAVTIQTRNEDGSISSWTQTGEADRNSNPQNPHKIVATAETTALGRAARLCLRLSEYAHEEMLGGIDQQDPATSGALPTTRPRSKPATAKALDAAAAEQATQKAIPAIPATPNQLAWIEADCKRCKITLPDNLQNMSRREATAYITSRPKREA